MIIQHLIDEYGSIDFMNTVRNQVIKRWGDSMSDHLGNNFNEEKEFLKFPSL